MALEPVGEQSSFKTDLNPLARQPYQKGSPNAKNEEGDDDDDGYSVSRM